MAASFLLLNRWLKTHNKINRIIKWFTIDGFDFIHQSLINSIDANYQPDKLKINVLTTVWHATRNHHPPPVTWLCLRKECWQCLKATWYNLKFKSPVTIETVIASFLTRHWIQNLFLADACVLWQAANID